MPFANRMSSFKSQISWSSATVMSFPSAPWLCMCQAQLLLACSALSIQARIPTLIEFGHPQVQRMHRTPTNLQLQTELKHVCLCWRRMPRVPTILGGSFILCWPKDPILIIEAPIRMCLGPV
ncbi:unnamed protein product [Symbiodinium sp. CCMP2592]|nr:unnamed protein product [Symbiodinium sp. CCMP2592]